MLKTTRTLEAKDLKMPRTPFSANNSIDNQTQTAWIHLQAGRNIFQQGAAEEYGHWDKSMG